MASRQQHTVRAVRLTALLAVGCLGAAACESTGPGVMLVEVTPDSVALSPGDTARLRARVHFAAGVIGNDWPAVWTSADTLVATVTSAGLITAVGAKLGPVAISAEVDGATGTAAVEVRVAFVTVDAGDAHTCGVTATGAGYCWGYNSDGEFGNGTTRPFQFAVPVAVFGGLRFRQLSAGSATCGVTTAGAPLCAGLNSWGQLGIGVASPAESLPQLVTGGLAFTRLWSLVTHTCGLVGDGAAYCWGRNTWSQLGNGDGQTQVAPAAVIGGHTFRHISIGGGHTCGLATDGVAYCWGYNLNGQLGSPNSKFGTLTQVSGPLTFVALDAGSSHTCGLAETGRAYCWGLNNYGQLGNGTVSGGANYTPQPVAGDLAFTHLSAGVHSTCGLTGAGQAYCWGFNASGQLGDGSKMDRTVPVAASAGFTFTQITVRGGVHACGLTTSGALYCWGNNVHGQLGDGTTETVRLTPVRVLGSGR